MNTGLIVIDNFYDNPDSIRDIALSCDYYSEKVSKGYPNGNAPWSGKMSKDTHSPSWIDAVVSKYLNKNLRQMRQLDSGSFRLSRETNVLGMFDNALHADSHEDIYYAGVLYLSKDQHTVPGTLFYKHKETGADRALSNKQLSNMIESKDCNDLNKWDIHTTSNVVYNRLIIYPASKFHGPGPCFGVTDETARLVQLFNWIDIK
jgi:hypothetical protein|tara:strand:- start:777 stop:1388 length:612 start_codon:yes stop_codon:yes gene_type:complete